jgi:hypothetical protein
VAVTHDQLCACLFAGLPHALAFRKRQRHGLFDERVFPMLGSKTYMFFVQLVRRCDIDPFDVRVCAECVCRGVRDTTERFRKSR